MSETPAAPPLDSDPTRGFGEAFAQDPFTVLAQESRQLFNVYQDSALDDVEKGKRLDGYFHLIASLDEATFSNMDGEVASGVPRGYIPDGFMDMGEVPDLNPADRYGRSLNYVDTYNTLHQHKAVFEFLFTNLDPAAPEFSGLGGDIRYQQTIISNIATEIRLTQPYGDPEPAERGGVLPISSITEASCQQHALTAQVLLQAFGIRSRLSKNYFATQKDIDTYGMDYLGGSHVSNVITMGEDNRVYMFDPTNPQLTKSGELMFGLFRMSKQVPDGAWLVTAQNGTSRKYTERDRMYWTVQRQPHLAAP